MYINGPREVAAAVTKVLPTRRNVLRGLPSDEDSLISEVSLSVTLHMHLYVALRLVILAGVLVSLT